MLCDVQGRFTVWRVVLGGAGLPSGDVQAEGEGEEDGEQGAGLRLGEGTDLDDGLG